MRSATHSFLVALSVLGCLIHLRVPTVDARTVCGSSFDDLPSRTLRAAVIFEGRVRQVRRANDSDPSESSGARHTVVFGVQKWLKSELRSASSADRLESVEVGYFSETRDEVACVAQLVPTGQTFIVFLASKSPSVTQVAQANSSGGVDVNRPNRRRNAVHYPISSFPVKLTKSHVAIVSEYTNCSKCGRLPMVLLRRANANVDAPGLVPTVITAGQPLDLQCQIRRGRPSPSRIDWFKDGLPVLSNKRIRLTHPSTKSLSSKLVIKKAKTEDGGVYECLAINVVGKSERANLSVTVEQGVLPTTPPHSLPCSDREHGYCMNGGTCYIMETLRRPYCQCPGEYHGVRCEVKRVNSFPVQLPTGPPRNVQEFEAILIICGVVIASLITVVFSIVIFSTIRRKRQEKFKSTNGYRQISPQKSPATSAKVNIQQETYADVQLRNGRVPMSVPMAQSPERASAINCRVPTPRHSAQGTVSNQDNGKVYRERLRAISATPDSKSLLDNGALVSEGDEPGSDHRRADAPDSDLSPLGGLSSTSANVVGAQSGSSRPLGGNQFFGDDGPVGLRSESTVAGGLEQTRGNRAETSASVGLQRSNSGPYTGSVPIESRC